MNEQENFEQNIYHIQVRGSLNGTDSREFKGLLVVPQENGDTRLVGRIEDQAALHDLLARFQALGLTLVFAGRGGCPCPKEKCPRHGLCQECAAYHGAKGKLSYCLRSRTKWDRQLSAFV